MFSKIQMVVLKRAKELLYSDVCDVIAYEKDRNEDGSVSTVEKLIFEDIPCKLSYNSSNSAKESEVFSSVSQSIKVFMSPEYIVKEGSKINITRGQECYQFKSSGTPIVFETHQEINLEKVSDKA